MTGKQLTRYCVKMGYFIKCDDATFTIGKEPPNTEDREIMDIWRMLNAKTVLKTFIRAYEEDE